MKAKHANSSIALLSMSIMGISAVAFGIPTAHADETDLLIPVGSEVKPTAESSEPWTVRSQTVQINTEVLDDLERGEVLHTDIKLFEGVSVRPIFKYFDRLGPGEYTWTGGLSDHELSSFNISACDGVVVAEFRGVLDGTFHVRPAGDGTHILHEVDLSKVQHQCQTASRADAPHRGDAGRQAARFGAEHSGETESGGAAVIDVLIVYTPVARVWADWRACMRRSTS